MYEHHIHNMARAVQQSLADSKGVQVEAEDFTEPLREYWADYAVMTWAIEDVVFQAEHSAWPMSNEQARDILREIEHGASAEYGITWDTLDEAIQSWAEGVDWPTLGDAELAKYSGNFVLCWQTPHRRLARYRVVAGSLIEAVRQARAISRHSVVQVQVLATEPWAEDDPAGSAEVGNELLVVSGFRAQTPSSSRTPISSV